MSRAVVVRITRQEIASLVSLKTGLPESVTDEMAIPTHTHGNPLIRWLFWRRYEEIARLADVDGATKALDFGCGLGIFLPTLCRSAAKVFAIDLYPQYAKELVRRRHLQVEFVSDLREIPDRSLDLVTAADVLEHIENLDEYLGQFARVLRPEGRLVISGPTENLVYKLGRYVAGFGKKGDYHLWSVDSLRERIVAFGYTSHRIRRLPWVLPPHLFKVCEFRLSSARRSPR